MGEEDMGEVVMGLNGLYDGGVELSHRDEPRGANPKEILRRGPLRYRLAPRFSERHSPYLVNSTPVRRPEVAIATHNIEERASPGST